MTRTIKFRAWHADSKKMILAADLDDPFHISTTPTQQGFALDTIFDLMQFTGLKDKNGLDIYEGDIVNVPKRMNGECEWEAYVGRVYFDDGAWLIERVADGLCESIIEDGLYGRPHLKIKIVGNIHQNPDLIPQAVSP